MKLRLSLHSAVFLTCLVPCLTFTLSGCADDKKAPGQDNKPTPTVKDNGQESPLKPSEPLSEKIAVGQPVAPKEDGLDNTEASGRELIGRLHASLTDTEVYGSIQFSPDGSLLAVAGPKNKVTLWDPAGKKKRAVLSAFTGEVTSVQFTADGQWIVALSWRDGDGLAVWETSTGKLLRTLKISATAIALTPDKKVITAGRHPDRELKIWDLETGKLERTIEEKQTDHYSPPAPRVSANGQWLAFAIEDGKKIAVMDLKTGTTKHRLSEHTEPVRVLALSADGKQLAAYAYEKDRRLIYWDLSTGKVTHRIEPEKNVFGGSNFMTHLTFSPAGKTIACGLDNGSGIDLFNPATGAKRCHLHGITMTIKCLAFSPDGQMLAAIDNYDKRIALYGLEVSRQERTIKNVNEGFNNVVGSATGDWLAVIDRRKAIDIYEMATGTKKHSLPGDFDSYVLALSPNGQRIVARGNDWGDTNFNYDFASKTKTPWKEQEKALPVQFSPNGKEVILGGYSLQGGPPGERTRRLESDQRGNIHRIVNSLDGTRLATVGDDSRIFVWDPRTDKLLWSAEAHDGNIRSAAFSADTRLLATGGGFHDPTICVWDVATGKRLSILEPQKGTETAVIGLVFAPDGKSLLSVSQAGYGSWDPVIWDLATKQPIQQLFGHQHNIRGLFALNKQKFASYDEKNVLIWDWDAILSRPPASFTLTEKEPLVAAPVLLHEYGQVKYGSLAVFSADGKVLAFDDDKHVQIVDTVSGKQLHKLKGHHDEIRSLLLSADGKTLVWASGDKSIRVWDVVSGKEQRTLVKEESTAGGLAWALDGKALVVSGGTSFENHGIVMIDFTTGAAKLLKEESGRQAGKFAVSPDGRWIAGVVSDKIVIWDAASGKVERHFESKSSDPNLAFSHDGKQLAIYGTRVLDRNNIEVRDWKSGKVLHDFATDAKRALFDFNQQLFFAPSGKKLCVRVGGSVWVWNLETGKNHRRVTNLHRMAADVVAFSPDCRYLATVGFADFDLKIWDASVLLDDAYQEAIAPLLAWGGKLSFRDQKLTLTIPIRGRKSGASLAVVKNLPRPVFLCLFDCSNLNPEDLSLLKGAELLKGLDLNDASNLSADGLRRVAELKRLEELKLPSGRFTEDDLECLKNLTGLKRLTLGRPPQKAEIWKQWATLTGLAELTVYFPEVESLANLALLPKLERLTLRLGKVEEALVPALLKCAQLKSLVLIDCEASDEVLRQLRTRVPEVATKKTVSGQ